MLYIGLFVYLIVNDSLSVREQDYSKVVDYFFVIFSLKK